MKNLLITQKYTLEFETLQAIWNRSKIYNLTAKTTNSRQIN